ncbi:hypothetical protein [uncultured Fibrobacter sp.]|uniref:hypothetical protein n=1 Tax=uncultured Fibrobacter sp. TaxID=261512 RepID=UPI0025DCB40C|nr:hypothetical protein [uncultured Fibrobacter sp.]
MKKLAFACLALAVATLVACSDDSSSGASKEKMVSCQERMLIDGEYENIMCFQAVESKRKLIEEICGEDEELSEYIEIGLQEEGCDENRLKKQCANPEDEDLSVFVYDKTMGRATCEEIWAKLSEEEDEEEDDYGDAGDIFSRDSNEVVSLYIASQKVCVEYKIFSRLNSKLKYRYDDSIDMFEGVVYGDGCENVEEKSVVVCSDDDSYNAMTVYFYDKELKGKTCEEIDPFEPMEIVY